MKRLCKTLYREPFLVCWAVAFAPGVLAKDTSPHFLAALAGGWGASYFADKLWKSHISAPRDSDGNPKGEDGTASSRSDDSAGLKGIAE